MTNRSKVGIGILAAVLIFLVAIYVLVDAVYVPQQEAIIYPGGELVDSVFVAQNNEYVKNDTLPTTHAFETIPYMVDVPKGTGAKIGTGTVYQVGGGYFAYVSEYTDQYDVQDIISSQFPVALLINYVPEATRITVQQEKTGYINGFKAGYLADTLYVTDGANSSESIVLGYALDVPEGNYFGNHMFIAVGTTTMSTESANACAQVLSAIIKTVRYDEGIDNELVRKAEQERLEQEKLEQEYLASLPSESLDGEPVDDAGMVSVVGDESVSEWPVTLPSDTSELTVDVRWTLNNPDAILELFIPDGSAYVDPVSKDNYSAQFKFYNAAAGTYLLRIRNYQQCGEISVLPTAETDNGETSGN